MIKKALFLMLSLLVFVTNVAAQEVEMADKFRGEGKIYVVIGVMLVLLIGLFVYLFGMDKRLKKLEDKK